MSNPLLAEERTCRREALLQATEPELDTILTATTCNHNSSASRAGAAPLPSPLPSSPPPTTLRDAVPYKDLKAHYFDQRDHSKIVKRLVRRLSDLGVHVELKTAA